MFVNGYNATGIKDITNKVGIPKGSFYNHFSSKEEFGLEVLRNYMSNGLNIHKNHLLNTSKSPTQRIRDFYEGNIQEYKKVLEFKMGCMMGNFSTEMADVNESFRILLDQGFDEQEQVIIECLKEAQSQSEIDEQTDVELLGSSIINGWHGALVRMKASATAKPLEDFKKYFLANL
ncbi:MAG: TetR family transcriptional regulator [Balneola sp.]|nr:MAG: TetR family transcriptional regulator [Balneola sp.]